MWTEEKKRRETNRKKRLERRILSHLVWLLSESDSSCFFQPRVFGVKGVHTIPEEKQGSHMKRMKSNILFITQKFLFAALILISERLDKLFMGGVEASVWTSGLLIVFKDAF